MSEIGHVFDFDDQFFRMITVSLAKTLSKRVRWINRFTPNNSNESGFIRVFLPFQTSLTGDETFVLDAFVDDIVDKRVSTNTDQYQRGRITFTGFNSRSDEFANPNQYLSKKETINSTLRKIISKVKAVPVTVNYDIEIQLATSNEIDKVSQKLMNVFYNYQFLNFDYYGLKLDAFFNLPDDKSIEIPRDIDMDSDRKLKLTFSLEVQTYYPIFMIDSDDLIVCDNDDEIDWEYLDIPKPTLEYKQSLKNLNQIYGQTALSGGSHEDENNEVVEGKTEIRKVYWYNMYREMEKYVNRNSDPNYKPSQWNKEDFDGVDPGQSIKNDNDLDNE